MEIAIFFRGVILFAVSLCIPLLMYIGYKLFEMGAKGEINITHEKDGKVSKISNLSPGAFCFLLSIVLGVYMINSDLKIDSHSEEHIGDDLSKNLHITDKKNKVISTAISFYGGAGEKVSSLVLAEYGRAGICLHGAKVTNRLNDKHLDECLGGVEKMMKRPISYAFYEDLKDYEDLYEQGDDTVAPNIQSWITSYMNKTED